MQYRPFRVTLKTPFRGVSERSGVLVRLPDAAPDFPWGEYSPFPDYSPARAHRWWLAAAEAAKGEWPAAVQESVAVNSIVPEVGPEAVAQFATAHGCRTAKVKVGGPSSTLAQDCARVEAVADALGAGGTVRVDANGSWSVDQAVAAIKALDDAVRTGGLGGLEYVEQPCASAADLALVRRKVDVPIAADESVRIPGDITQVLRLEAADILVLKVNPLGGVRACLELAERAERPIVVSSAMESSVGLQAGLALALALPPQPYAHGLGTGALLATDTVAETLVPVDGRMHMRPLVVTA